MRHLLTTALCGPLLVFAGSAGAADEVTLQLKWLTQAQFVTLLADLRAALAGFFLRATLLAATFFFADFFFAVFFLLALVALFAIQASIV